MKRRRDTGSCVSVHETQDPVSHFFQFTKRKTRYRILGLALLAHGEALDAALTRAVKALHRAKNAGRNRVDIALAAA